MAYMSWDDYKNKLSEWQKGSKFNPDTESDMRCKKYLLDSMNDDILRKMIMMSMISEGAVPNEVAKLYITRRLIHG